VYKRFLAIILLIFCSSCMSGIAGIAAEATADEDDSRSGAFTSYGLGGGFWYMSEEGEPATNEEFRGSIGLDYKVGGTFADQFSFHFNFCVSFNDFDEIREGYEWLFRDNDWRLLKLTVGFPLIFLMPFAGSYTVTGPGFTYYFAPDRPSGYIDFGFGFSGFLRPSDREYLVGVGFMAGGGFDFTDKFGLGLRLLWTPAKLMSFWKETTNHVVSLMMMMNINL
jgi:hypothetical protein